MPELARESGPRPSEAVVTFGHFARERFGLAHAGRDPLLLSRRLKEAMRSCGWQGPPSEFVRALVESADGSPLSTAAAEALTNQETSFFRDVDHLRLALRTLAPRLASAVPAGEPLRILSAGCSTGEEAYSITMLLLDELHLLWGRPAQVWGADLSASATAQARAGLYSAAGIARAGQGPEAWASRFFRLDGQVLVARELLRERTRFVRANLLDSGPLQPCGPFDLVICRNVFIYFDAQGIERGLRSLSSVCRPGAALVLGNAESGEVPAGWARRTDGLVWLSRPEAEAA